MPAVWYIYHVKDCRHARPSPKDKYVAIVCSDLDLMGFLINSKVHKFIQKRPDLLACQVTIKASHYKFLDHDSHIDCIELYQFKDAELMDAREPINEWTKAEIKEAVANSKTIEVRYKKLILGKD